MKSTLIALSFIPVSAAIISPFVHADNTADRQQLSENTQVITATRQGMAVEELAHAVTVIDREQLNNQLQTSRNLGEVLAKTVPGMAPASQTLTNWSQTLRGRNMLVLIDGIPQNSNRNSRRDLMSIDVGNIERIEVLRGGSAVYGSGAAGGVVNIITRRNVDETISKVGLTTSLSNLDSDSLRYRLEQYTGGQSEDFDYGFNVAWEQTKGFFDADGDRIAPEPSQGDLSDTGSISLAGKLRWHLEGSMLTLSASHFDAEQDTDYTSDASVNSAPKGSVKAKAISGLQLDKQPRTETSLLNLAWNVDSTPLGSMDAQVYYRDHHARFFPFASTPVQQYFLNSESIGSRLTFNTDIDDDNLIRWGVDYNHEDYENPQSTYDRTDYDNSDGRVFTDTGDRIGRPPATQEDLAAFAQYEQNLTENFRWELGARYQHSKASFDTFTTMSGNRVQGGEISFDDVMYNTGAVYSFSEYSEVYANFSQGFELPDIGLRLNNASSTFTLSDSELKPIKTDNYEIGTRSDWGDTQLTSAVFYSTSDLGQPQATALNIFLPRAKERIYGIELTADHRISDQWSVGGLATWMEGETYDETLNRWRALDNLRIPPLQLRAYVGYTPDSYWFHRLQVNYSGNRDAGYDDRTNDNQFGRYTRITDYTTLDYQTRYENGQHTVNIGIENLLNNQYHTVYGQALRGTQNTSHIPASGATLAMSYQYTW
ncbi:TonB-dependent receptor [Aliamphritea hakodatensis]|uniref:TonB-dependent receptor n=1 Tax=Aliamphritea hakodatensis TaxID=2895352 RepID=UPI0022FD6CEC|nr:TonB-dependent receptor [Aliamphritea hakodatensis]